MSRGVVVSGASAGQEPFINQFGNPKIRYSVLDT